MAGVKGRSGGHNRISPGEHQLRGTYRADRHGPVSPPGGEENAGPVAPPADLSAAEQQVWVYYAPLLASAHVLTPSDRDTLADYCRACAAIVDRQRRLAQAFRRRPIDPTLIRLYDAQVRGWIEKKTRLAFELGLTALARTRRGWTGHHQRPGESAPAPAPSKFAELQERATRLRRPVGLPGSS